MTINPTLPAIPAESNDAWGTTLNTALSTIVTGVNTHTHAGADIVSGTVAVAEGGTGASTAAAALTNLGAQPATTGAGMFRASTGTVDTASGQRAMTGFDNDYHVSSGYTVSHANGTITVPADDWYTVSVHARLSSNNVTGQHAIIITDGANELSRSTLIQGGSTTGVGEVHHTDRIWLAASTVVHATYYSSVSVSLVGNAAGSYYYMRIVRG